MRPNTIYNELEKKRGVLIEKAELKKLELWALSAKVQKTQTMLSSQESVITLQRGRHTETKIVVTSISCLLV